MLWTVRVGNRATTVAKDGTAVYTFDLEGRPVSWWEAERTYKRSLASEVHETYRIHDRTIRTLPEIEAAERFEKIVDRARKAREHVLDEAAHERLDRILEWTPEALLEEADRFAAAYSPIAILPPDQLAEELDHPYTRAQAVLLSADFYHLLREWPQCLAQAERGLELADRWHFPFSRAGCTLHRGVALARLAHLEDGIEIREDHRLLAAVVWMPEVGVAQPDKQHKDKERQE